MNDMLWHAREKLRECEVVLKLFLWVITFFFYLMPINQLRMKALTAENTSWKEVGWEEQFS